MTILLVCPPSVSGATIAEREESNFSFLVHSRREHLIDGVFKAKPRKLAHRVDTHAYSKCSLAVT